MGVVRLVAMAVAFIATALVAGCGGEPGGTGTGGNADGVTAVITQAATESDDEDVEAAPSATPADATTDASVDVIEDGFTQEGADLSLGAVLKNPSTDADAIGVEVSINVLDASENILDTETAEISVIPAGSKFVFGQELQLEKGAKAASVELVADVNDSQAAQYPVPEVKNARFQADEFGGWTVRAQVTNNLDSTLSSITDVFAIVRDADGEIVGGSSSFPKNELKPGRSGAVEIGSFMDLPGETAEVSVDNEVD